MSPQPNARKVLPRPTRRTLIRLMGLVVPLAFSLLILRWLSPWLPSFAVWVESLGIWAPVAYVAAYITAVVFMLPAFLLIIAGGAVFGIWYGAALALTGAIGGATIAFLVARYWARERVARHITRNPLLNSLDNAIGKNGLRLVFLLRLSPVVPFVLTNYALGATRVRLQDFLLGTVGLAPIVLTYAALGKVSGAQAVDGSNPVSVTVLAVGIAATVILGVLLTRMVQNAISEAGIRTAEPAPDGGADGAISFP